jgi:hypothetical protein
MTARAWVEPSNEGHEAERREQKLVLAYRDHLKRKGVAETRLKIVPDDEHKAPFSDVYVPDRNLLVEAKGNVERGAIRMAIGQLADYRRFLEPRPDVAVLVPERPRPDVWALLRAEQIDVIWPEGAGFEHPRRSSRLRPSRPELFRARRSRTSANGGRSSFATFGRVVIVLHLRIRGTISDAADDPATRPMFPHVPPSVPELRDAEVKSC